MDETTSVKLISALATAWSEIRFHHPEVPGVVLLAAPASRGHLNVLGHFAALRWKPRHTETVLLHEVVVVAEHLDRSADDIVETLLHEAAHSLNFARGLKDCTASQYHNGKFRSAAEELGLDVQRVPHYGWALTTLKPETREMYGNVILALEAVLVHRRKPILIVPPSGPPIGGSTPTGGDEDDETPTTIGRSRKAVCACNPAFIIRVSKKVMDATTIRCDSCGEPFRLV